MSDRVEPTKEQRAAAVKHHYKLAALPDKGYLTDWVRTGDSSGRAALDAVVSLARLLAEREHKLTKVRDALIANHTDDLRRGVEVTSQLRADLDAARAELQAALAVNADNTREAISLHARNHVSRTSLR
jgi:hypothetical protein